MISLTATNLRRLADYLESLATLEVDTGISANGYSGYTEITLTGESIPDTVIRIRRINLAPEPDLPNEPGPVAYVAELGDY